MNLSRVTFACAISLPLCAAAQYVPTTDNSTQIYGRLDGSVNVVKYSGQSGTTRKTVSSDTSLLGFRGTEQLGGGLAAYYKLEHGFFLDTGAPGSATSFWNREAFVGLRSTQLGAIQLGSHWDPYVFVTSKIDPFGRAQLGSNFSLLQGSGVRGYAITMPNSALYASPVVGGFSLRALAQAPEGTGLNKNYAGVIEYSNDRAYAVLAYDNIQLARATVGLSGTAPVRSKTYALGGTYRFDAVKLFAYGQQNRTDALKNVTGWQTGASVPIGLGEIRMAYQRTGQTGGSASLTALGYVYYLSKRTFVYTTVARLDNSAATRFAMFPSSQDLTAAPPALGQDLTGMQFGLRHTF